MAVRFITGKTGSGKTNHLYQNIIERAISLAKVGGHEKLLLIVPEQSTLDVQHRMIDHHPNHCITDIEILSFGRLAHRMSDELGVSGRTVISDVGKNMMIQRLVGEHQDNFPFLGKNIHKKGYVNELRSLMSEFSRYTVSSDALTELLKSVDDPLLQRKLTDCRVLFERFDEAVNHQYFSGDTMMDLLVTQLPASGFLENVSIYIDGFYGYTPIQLKLIEGLMLKVKNLTITVTIDNDLLSSGGLSENHLYYESHEMYSRLTRMVTAYPELDVEHLRMFEDTDLGDNVHDVKPAMSKSDNDAVTGRRATVNHLRDWLYQYPYKVFDYKPVGMTLSRVSSVTKEVTYVRDSILKLVMDKGYRYRDIAVLAGDVGRYDKVLTTIMSQGEIPYYIDRKRSILNNDAAAFVLGCVRMLQYDMTYNHVFAYLKSGYVACDTTLIDYMENYVIRYGIRGMKRWLSEWTLRVPDIHMEPDAPVAVSLLEQINELKSELLEPIVDYDSKKALTTKEHITALFDFLDSIGFEQSINEKAAIYEAEGKLNLYREYSQVYRIIMDMLDQLCEIGPETSMSYEAFADILEAGFEQLEIGNVPARMDEVLIGDLTRTRLSEKKAIFILGINEGLVPALKEGTSLLTDRERDMLDSKGFSLAPSARKNLFRDQFYIYLKLLGASQRLYLSYSMTDDEGSVTRAAHLIHMLKKLFPLLTEVDIDKLYEDRVIINRSEAVFGQVMKSMQNHRDRDIGQLKRWFAGTDAYSDRLTKALAGRTHHMKKERLSSDSIDKMYGKTLLNTVSRLEQFSRCPFAHFARYGLGANEREAYEITMPQLGLVFHRVIELFSKRVIDRQIAWSDITDAIRETWVSEIVDITVADDVHIVFFDSERNRFRIERLKKILSQTLKVIGYQISQGSFEPVSAEWQFKGDDKEIEALNVPLNRGKSMCLLGTIDRVDMYQNDSAKYITIVDYKSSNQDFDLADMYHGLQLQLIVYLNAAVEVTAKSSEREVKPAGVFYFKIDDPFIEAAESMDDEQREKEILKKFRLKGVVLSDDEIIRHLDSKFTKESAVIPVKRNKTGELSGTSKTVTEDDLNIIRSYIADKTKVLGNEVIGGVIEPKPFKKKDLTACEYCEYASICGFDSKLPGHEYNELRSEKNFDYIEGMKKCRM